jgi:hypothetical protein
MTKNRGQRRIREYKISRYTICGQFFYSKKELKEYKDTNHRIINSRP